MIISVCLPKSYGLVERALLGRVHILASKIVIYNFLLTSLLLFVELLDELRDVVFDLEGLGALQVLLLAGREEHRVLLLRAEVEQELMLGLLHLAELDLDHFVRVNDFKSLLLAHLGPLVLDMLYVDDFELDGLGRLVVVLIIRVTVLTARGTGAPGQLFFFFFVSFGLRFSLSGGRVASLRVQGLLSFVVGRHTFLATLRSCFHDRGCRCFHRGNLGGRQFA